MQKNEQPTAGSMVMNTLNDLGFGTKVNSKAQRLVNQDGTYNSKRKGLKVFTPYQSLVEMSWVKFFILVFLFYFSSNAFFALLFSGMGVGALSGDMPTNWISAFTKAYFFSVQTFTTVGYGAIYPIDFGANILAAMVALTGLVSFAIVTGLFYARFSKPKARILFGKKALMAPYKDISSFQFRIANMRDNPIINLEAKVTFSYIERVEGQEKRRYKPLVLEIEKIMLFPLNWTIVHPIDRNSPLWGVTAQELERMQGEFVILLAGFDDTYNQSVHRNSSYTWEEILWGKRFQPMFYTNESGQTVLELDKIDAVE